jgi:hypothetical protein
MLQDFLLQHHTEYLQEILMVTFLLQDSLLQLAAAPAGPATPTGLYANTFSDTEISTGWNATAGATGMSCIVLLGLIL